MRLQGYKYSLEYEPGARNAADYLSRSPMSQLFREKPDDSYIRVLVSDSAPRMLTIDEIRTATAEDKILQQVIADVTTNNWPKSPELNPYRLCKDSLSVIDNVLLKGHLIVMPAKLQHATLTVAHQSHQGIVKTKSLLCEKV